MLTVGHELNGSIIHSRSAKSKTLPKPITALHFKNMSVGIIFYVYLWFVASARCSMIDYAMRSPQVI